MFRTFSLLLIAVFTTVAARADAVLDWNAQALGAIRTSKTPPPMAARNLAILHVALFDAVNGVTPNYTPYVVQPGAPAGASADAAAAQAGYVVLSSLYPALQSFWDTQLAALLAPIPAGQPKTDGTQWGSSVAQAILASRQNDGAFASVPYVPVLLPGHWRPTLPAFAPALFPQWPNVTPFSLESGSQFRPKGPPPLHSGRYLADWFMVKRLGEQNSKWRSPDQTQIALFWSDGGGTATPPGHWNEIAAIVSAQRHLSLIDNA
ncbi:MAG: chemotaxis protein CheB, partial [Verrucomicrobiae bacterium]|nr:chemotaxis protein CheB [Verrucomicrobiae bacterium]